MTCFSFTLHHHCGLAGRLTLCYYYSGTLIDNLSCLEQHWEPLYKERGEVSKRELPLKHPPGQNIHRLCSNFVALMEVKEHTVNSSSHDHSSTGQILSLHFLIRYIKHDIYKIFGLAERELKLWYKSTYHLWVVISIIEMYFLTKLDLIKSKGCFPTYLFTIFSLKKVFTSLKLVITLHSF